MSRKEDEDVSVTQLYRSPGPLPTRPWGVLTGLVSYMYLTYVHYMYIIDVLSFPFGSRHWPYWDCEVRSKSEWRVSCIAPIALWLFYNTDHNRQIYRGHIPWQIGIFLSFARWWFLAAQLVVVTGDCLAAPNLSALLTEAGADDKGLRFTTGWHLLTLHATWKNS